MSISSIPTADLAADVACLISDARSHLRSGHVIAAAATFRSALELWARTASGLPVSCPFWSMTLEMAKRDVIISPYRRNRLNEAYELASAYIHGRRDDRERLLACVDDVSTMLTDVA